MQDDDAVDAEQPQRVGGRDVSGPDDRPRREQRQLADRVDRLVGELAEGELLELTRLAARVVRVFETSHSNGGARR